MRLHNLKLKNIGPFKEGVLEFITKDDKKEHHPVTIITGENGTGKTIILDAIRGLFVGELGSIERGIVNEYNNFELSCLLSINSNKLELHSSEFIPLQDRFVTNHRDFNLIFYPGRRPKDTPKWIVNYWTSKLAIDSFQLGSLITPKAENFLDNALAGVQKNIEVVELITFFDYIRSAESKKEKEIGEFFYDTLKEIIKLSLDNGELAYVKRTSLEPVIKQNGKEITLDKLSSGNLYLIQRMISLLGQMYAIHVLHSVPLNKVCKTPGLLLIDEAENHLHPKWQKTFINNILKVFPNLQIILTTHSPFIVSSVKNARVYVCQSMDDHAVVEDQTAEYSNIPVEEILISPLFGGTYAFNSEISDLLKQRKVAIESNDTSLKEETEQQLKQINPEYFSYFDTEKLIEELSNNRNDSSK